MIHTIAILKKKMMCGTLSIEKATVKMVEVLVMAQFVVGSSRMRHAHDAPHFAAVEVRHRRDVGVVEARWRFGPGLRG